MASRATEAVALALESEVCVGDARRGQGRDQRLRLRGRHDPVVEALHHEDRARDPVEEMDRRALPVALGHRRIRSDEPVDVARLELVRVARERLEVADPVPADARRRTHRGRRGRAASCSRRRSPFDRQPVAVDIAALDEEAGGGDGVVDIDDPPRDRRAAAIRPAVAGAAAVVDVDDRDAATRQQLDAQLERRSRRWTSGRHGSGRRAAAARPSGAVKSGFARRVVERVGGPAVGDGNRSTRACEKSAGSSRSCVDRRSTPGRRRVPGSKRARTVGLPTTAGDATIDARAGEEAVELGERRLDLADELARADVDRAGRGRHAGAMATIEPSGRNPYDERPKIQADRRTRPPSARAPRAAGPRPGGRGSTSRFGPRRNGARRRGTTRAGRSTRPGRRRPARTAPRVPSGEDRRDSQPGGVPGHVRVVPFEPRQQPAVGERRGRRGSPVPARGRRRLAAVEWHGDDRVDDIGLAGAPRGPRGRREPAAGRIGPQVGETPRTLGRDRYGVAAPGSRRYSRLSAKFEKTTVPPATTYEPPPYSWTRVRTLNGGGVRSVVEPSADALTRTRRPPSAGRASSQYTSSPSTHGSARPMTSPTTSLDGDGHCRTAPTGPLRSRDRWTSIGHPVRCRAARTRRTRPVRRSSASSVDAQGGQLEPRDLGVDRLGDDVDPAARARRGGAATYSADSAWLAKLMSMTAAGWPSAAPRLTSRPSAMRLSFLPPRSNSWTLSRTSRTWPSARARRAERSSSASKWPELAMNAPSFIDSKCSRRKTLMLPVAVINRSPSCRLARRHKAKPSIRASSARTGSTSTTATCAPWPAIRAAMPLPDPAVAGDDDLAAGDAGCWSPAGSRRGCSGRSRNGCRRGAWSAPR